MGRKLNRNFEVRLHFVEMEMKPEEFELRYMQWIENILKKYAPKVEKELRVQD